jgi:hypothetical protein
MQPWLEAEAQIEHAGEVLPCGSSRSIVPEFSPPL